MVERKADGGLRQTMALDDSDWLREGGPEVRAAVIARQTELGRALTEEEKEEVASSLTTSE